MSTIPTISSYGDYSNDNYGVNALVVYMETLTLYYSYKTIVAYSDSQDGLVCCENVWTTTTGKHLNWIQPKKQLRISYEQFTAMLQAALERHIN